MWNATDLKILLKFFQIQKCNALLSFSMIKQVKRKNYQ